MKNLSISQQIDILKFLNFNQLFSVQQTNYYFNLLIDQNKWILALNKFDSISIDKFNINYIVIDQSNIVYYPVNDELLEKWQSAINKQISLYFCKDDFQSCKNCSFGSYVLSLRIIRKCRSFYLSSLNRGLKLKLPKYPKNIKEMQIIRFWLEQIFRCSFTETMFDDIIFNSQMIKLLFEDDKNIKLNINTRIFSTYFFNSIYKYQFEFILNHLVVTDFIWLNFLDMNFNKDEQNNFLLKLLLNSRISCIYINCVEDVSTLYNLIINNIKTSKDCSKIVPYIIFGETSEPRLKMKIETYKIERNGSKKVALCEYKNIYNPKIKFLAQFYSFNNYRFFDYVNSIEIKRIIEE